MTIYIVNNNFYIWAFYYFHYGDNIKAFFLILIFTNKPTQNGTKNMA